MATTDRSDQSENKKVAKAAGIVGSATLLSRILGYVRDMAMALFFGAGFASDAFIAAFRLPNLLRRLFGEGSFSIAFIPVFTEYLVNKGKEEAYQLASSASKILLLTLFLTAIAGILCAPLIIDLIAPGFGKAPEKTALTILLTRIMFPYVVFIGMVALFSSILNALGHFAAPALAPVLLNVAMIGAMILGSFYFESESTRVVVLSSGVLVGGALQLCLQIPFLIKNGVRFWKKTVLVHPGLKRIGILMIPTVFGAAVYQINILVGTMLASLLPQGSVSYLYYADRLVQFPLGIFAYAVATAVLPSLSRQAAVSDIPALKDTFSHAMGLVMYITIPSMAGLILLREPIVALLFERGAFGFDATRLTASALLYYSMGLWAFSAVRIVVSTFYALQDTKTPVKTAALSIAANIILGILLMGPMKHNGLALATSLASMINLAFLMVCLRKKLGLLGITQLAGSCLKTLISAVVMSCVVYGLGTVLFKGGDHHFIGLFFGLMICISGGVVVFAAASFILKSPELHKVLALIGKGDGKK